MRNSSVVVICRHFAKGSVRKLMHGPKRRCFQFSNTSSRLCLCCCALLPVAKYHDVFLCFDFYLQRLVTAAERSTKRMFRHVCKMIWLAFCAYFKISHLEGVRSHLKVCTSLAFPMALSRYLVGGRTFVQNSVPTNTQATNKLHIDSEKTNMQVELNDAMFYQLIYMSLK